MSEPFVELTMVGGSLQAERLCEALEMAGLSVLIEHVGPTFTGASSIQQFRLMVPHSQSQRARLLMEEDSFEHSEPLVSNF